MTHRVFRQVVLPKLIDIERGYTDDPDDPGGKTNHGITEKVARAYGFKGDMRDLSADLAEVITRVRYWDLLKLDDVAEMAPMLAVEICEAGFNCGQAWAARWLQEWLNALNRDQKDYMDIKTDGLVGRMTLQALREYLEFRGPMGVHILLNGLNAEQAMYYKDLKREKYLNGWMEKRVNIT